MISQSLFRALMPIKLLSLIVGLSLNVWIPHRDMVAVVSFVFLLLSIFYLAIEVMIDLLLLSVFLINGCHPPTVGVCAIVMRTLNLRCEWLVVILPVGALLIFGI